MCVQDTAYAEVDITGCMYCKRFRTCINGRKSLLALVVPGALLVCSRAQNFAHRCMSVVFCNTSLKERPLAQQQQLKSASLKHFQICNICNGYFCHPKGLLEALHGRLIKLFPLGFLMFLKRSDLAKRLFAIV